MKNSKVLSLVEIKEKVLSLVVTYPEIDSISIFGSYSRGEATTESDIDLLIGITGENYTDTYFDFFDAVEKLLEKDVDLITLNGLDNSPYKENILKGAKPLYGKSKE